MRKKQLLDELTRRGLTDDIKVVSSILKVYHALMQHIQWVCAQAGITASFTVSLPLIHVIIPASYCNLIITNVGDGSDKVKLVKLVKSVKLVI